ncbi:flagellin [Serratia sp. Leaf51]|nr:flagellin [Serratia sp. Leaf51]
MAQVINTNSLSLMTQNNLNKSQSALGTAIERLSSGLRINSAKDDAAGQAISNRFTSNITGLTQASRNANDGISVAQTTEGSLSEINNNLQRIRELSVQAANGTNSSSDLDSIQDEITSRLSEIDRVSGQTQFNGVNVLAKDSTMSIQVGANDGETIKIDLKAITADTLGLTGFNVNGKGSVANTATTAKDLTAAGYTAGAAAADGTVTYSGTIKNKAATGADLLAGLKTGDTVTGYAGTDTGLGVASATYTYNADSKSFKFDAANVSAAGAQAYLTPKAGDTATASVKIGSTTQDVIISSNGNITAKDDGAQLYIAADGKLSKNDGGTPNAASLTKLMNNTTGTAAVETTITTSDGVELHTAGTAAGTGGSFDTVKNATVTAGAFTNKAVTVNTAGGPFTTTADGASDAFKSSTGGFVTASTTASTFFAQTNGNITNSTGALVYTDAEGSFTTDAATTSAATADPLKALDAAISKVDQFRSSLGAVQNRFDSAITNLNNTTTNLASAQSRIQDADYATEVSAMSKAQILQQAGTSVLSKANQVPQSVLSLLQ